MASNEPIKPIPTYYAGCHFRSRLEARWAVFFDSLGIEWEHEPEGFETSAGPYLPDFRIDVAGEVMWFEVKPPDAPVDLRHQALADLTGLPLIVARGLPRDCHDQRTKPTEARLSAIERWRITHKVALAEYARQYHKWRWEDGANGTEPKLPVSLPPAQANERIAPIRAHLPQEPWVPPGYPLGYGRPCKMIGPDWEPYDQYWDLIQGGAANRVSCDNWPDDPAPYPLRITQIALYRCCEWNNPKLPWGSYPPMGCPSIDAAFAAARSARFGT